MGNRFSKNYVYYHCSTNAANGYVEKSSVGSTYLGNAERYYSHWLVYDNALSGWIVLQDLDLKLKLGWFQLDRWFQQLLVHAK